MNCIILFSINPELINDIKIQLARYIRNREKDIGIAISEITQRTILASTFRKLLE